MSLYTFVTVAEQKEKPKELGEFLVEDFEKLLRSARISYRFKKKPFLKLVSDPASSTHPLEFQ